MKREKEELYGFKFYEKDGLKYCSFPIAGTPYCYEAWGTTYNDALKALQEGLISNKF